MFESLSSGEHDSYAILNFLLRPLVELGKTFGIPSPCSFEFGSLFSGKL